MSILHRWPVDFYYVIDSFCHRSPSSQLRGLPSRRSRADVALVLTFPPSSKFREPVETPDDTTHRTTRLESPDPPVRPTPPPVPFCLPITTREDLCDVGTLCPSTTDVSSPENRNDADWGVGRTLGMEGEPRFVDLRSEGRVPESVTFGLRTRRLVRSS